MHFNFDDLQSQSVGHNMIAFIHSQPARQVRHSSPHVCGSVTTCAVYAAPDHASPIRDVP
jgi:hypothetical protein